MRGRKKLQSESSLEEVKIKIVIPVADYESTAKFFRPTAAITEEDVVNEPKFKRSL